MAASPVALIVLTMLSTAAFGTLVAFLVIQNVFPNNVIFNQTLAEIAQIYPMDQQPAFYAWIMWLPIFLFQLGWMGYAFSTMCRSTDKGLVLVNPVMLPEKFHFAWILSCSAIVLWAFLIDRNLLLGSALALTVSTIFGFAALSTSILRTARYERKMQVEMYADLMCVRVLVQNGLDLFFSWSVLAMFRAITMALAYDPSMPFQFSQEDASSLCLYTLGAISIVWSILENTTLFRFVRFLFGGYIVQIWVLSAVIVDHHIISQKNTIITIVLLCHTVVCLAVKIIFVVLNPTVKYKVSFYSKTKKYKLLDEEQA